MNLRAENITFGYDPREPVLRNVTLEVVPGRVTALFGPNGCGKSTLLRCLNGSLRPQSGSVMLGDRPVVFMTPREIACQIAVVPQDTPHDVPFTAAQMVMLGRYARWDAWGQESPEDTEIVQACLRRMNVADLADRPFSHLSGGERQRVVIARALAQEGRGLLLDEPALHLDIAHQLELYRLVRTLAAEGLAVLIVCHDLLLAPLFLDTVVLLAHGRIIATGRATEVLAPDRIAAAFGTRVRVAWADGTSVHAALERDEQDPLP
jgi:iron complex transport system ATP-binding protein